MRTALLLVPALLVALLALARADELATCPECGTTFSYAAPTATNDAGGVDSDGCRYAVGSDSRLFVPELREVVACPSTSCAAAFFRGHLAAARQKPPAPIDSSPLQELGAAGALAPRAVELACAIATYRAYGLEPFGIAEDAQAFDGKLWLRVAWAVREAAVGEDDVRRLPFLYAPRTPEDGGAELAALEQRFQARGAGGIEGTPIEAALAKVDEARVAFAPFEPRDAGRPSRALQFGRGLGALDEVERTLLALRADRDSRDAPGSELTARELDLALARAAFREGDADARERWIARATLGREVPELVREAGERLRSLAAAEAVPLGLALGCFSGAAGRATGERRTQLWALAADAARRSGDLPRARALVQRALEGAASGPGAARARALQVRLGDAK